MKHIPKLLSIKLSLEKGKDRCSILSGELETGLGLRGDAYSKPGDREICLMAKSTVDQLKNYSDGLCVKRFVATLLIDLDPNLVEVGDILVFDQTEIQVTFKGKKCFKDCKLVKNRSYCPLKTEPLFARVLLGGKIKID